MNSQPPEPEVKGQSLDRWWCVQNEQIKRFRRKHARPLRPRDVCFPCRLSVNPLNQAEGVVKVFKVEKGRLDPALKKGKGKSPGGKSHTKSGGR